MLLPAGHECPVEQAEQSDCEAPPAEARYEPAAQFEGVMVALEAQYWPMGQGTHALCEVEAW